MHPEKAKESPAIRHAREHLKHRIEEENKHFNPKEIKQTLNRMHHWITRHASERRPLSLQEKKIKREPAQRNYLIHLERGLKENHRKGSQKRLAGRVSKSPSQKI